MTSRARRTEPPVDNRIQLRLDPDLEGWLITRAGLMHGECGEKSLSLQAKSDLGLLQDLLAAELQHLRMPLAWMNCIADVLAGAMLDSSVGTPRGIVYGEVADAFWMDGGCSYGTKWHVNETDLQAWLATLGPTADHALRHAVRRRWKTKQEPTREGWRTVGIIVIPDDYLLRHLGTSDRPALTRAAQLLAKSQTSQGEEHSQGEGNDAADDAHP